MRLRNVSSWGVEAGLCQSESSTKCACPSLFVEGMERSVGLLVVEPVDASTLAANDDWVMGQANALLLEDISNQAIVREATLDNDTFYTFPHGVSTNGLSLKPELATSYINMD